MEIIDPVWPEPPKKPITKCFCVCVLCDVRCVWNQLYHFIVYNTNCSNQSPIALTNAFIFDYFFFFSFRSNENYIIPLQFLFSVFSFVSFMCAMATSTLEPKFIRRFVDKGKKHVCVQTNELSRCESSRGREIERKRMINISDHSDFVFIHFFAVHTRLTPIRKLCIK